MFEGPRVVLKRRLRTDMRLVEIGPLCAPLIAKRDGWSTCIVDRQSRADLVTTYAFLGDECATIEEVDVVWRDGALHESFDASLHGTYDAIVCAHVLEHLVDPIAFLASAAILLRPGGELLLMLPDKRFSFDYFRPLTMTGDLYEAHSGRAAHHAPRTAFNHVAYAVLNRGRVSRSFERPGAFHSSIRWRRRLSAPTGMPARPASRGTISMPGASRRPASSCWRWSCGISSWSASASRR